MKRNFVYLILVGAAAIAIGCAGDGDRNNGRIEGTNGSVTAGSTATSGNTATTTQTNGIQ